MPSRKAYQIVLRICFRLSLQLRPFSTAAIFPACHNAQQLVCHHFRDLVDFCALNCASSFPSILLMPEKYGGLKIFMPKWKVRFRSIEVGLLNLLQTSCHLFAFTFVQKFPGVFRCSFRTIRLRCWSSTRRCDQGNCHL